MKYILKLAFDGTAYHGWQRQKNAHSVQQQIETALGVLTGTGIELTGCGRTDTGVHARCYYAHFEYDKKPDPRLVHKLNSLLPKDIAIESCRAANPDFHARFSALSREYRYFIHSKKDPFLEGRSWFFTKKLNLELMNRACQILMEHDDFASFCKKGADNKTAICKLFEANWVEQDHRLIFTIRADRFLRNMVRAIVGTMVDVGLGKISIEGFGQIIEAKDRQKSGSSVDASGLYLWEIRYPEF